MRKHTVGRRRADYGAALRIRVGPRELPPRRAVAGAMQSMYQCECTSEEYVTQRLWLEASVPECDYCKPEGLDCTPVLHGYYDRVYPRGARVRRYRCLRTGRTISMLPSCLVSYWRGDVQTMERIALEREEKSSFGKIARWVAERFYPPEQPIEGPLRWVKRRACAGSSFVKAMVNLYPEEFEGVEPTVTAMRGHLGSDQVLVKLRQIAGDDLVRLSPPLGLRPRTANVIAGPEGQFHKARGYRGPPEVWHAPD